MYLLHCKKCHHEWESVEDEGICDWCGAGSYPLAEHSFDILKIFKSIVQILKDKNK